MCCSWVYHQKASEGKCAHLSVSEERRCWTTMDKSLHELLLIEVRIPTRYSRQYKERKYFVCHQHIDEQYYYQERNSAFLFESHPCQGAFTEVSIGHHKFSLKNSSLHWKIFYISSENKNERY